MRNSVSSSFRCSRKYEKLPLPIITILSIESNHPNCGIIIAGDFNRLNIDSFCRHFRLKQIVKFQTRQNATLDLIITNMGEYYSQPERCSPFGL
jgi:hypothetical protein